MASAKWSSPTVCWAPTNSQRGFAGSSAVRITSTYPFPGRSPDRALGPSRRDPRGRLGLPLTTLLLLRQVESIGFSRPFVPLLSKILCQLLTRHGAHAVEHVLPAFHRPVPTPYLSILHQSCFP